MSSNIVIKSSSSKNKSLVYYYKYIEIILNDKFNWASPHASKKFENNNKNLYAILKTIIDAKNRNKELRPYDLMLIVQEGNVNDEDLILQIFKNIKEKINDPLHLFDYMYDYDEYQDNNMYNDLFIEKEYNNHSLLMLVLKKNYNKIAKFLSSYKMINNKVESYNQYLKKYVNIYTYALDNKNYDFLNTYLKRDSNTFWKYTRHTPLSLYESIEDKSLPLIDTIIENNIHEFNNNKIYMELSMGLNQKAVIKLIEYGEINPFYIDKSSGNSALISATFTRNATLFEKLMEIAPLWYILNKNVENKSAIDYLNQKSKKVINNYMYDRLHTFIKINCEKPKVIIINGKERYYINNDIQTEANTNIVA